MRYLFLFFISLCMFLTACSQRKYSITNFRLFPAVYYYDNQFSGLYTNDSALFLLSESRLGDNREAVLYSISLGHIDQYLIDSNFILPHKKHPIIGLDVLREKMNQQQQVYEGLEAIVMNGNTVYLSVETATPSGYCYILKGIFSNDQVILDTSMLRKLRKPTRKNGEHIYNAGFEAMGLYNNKLQCIFEYNYFDKANYIYQLDTALKDLDSIRLSPGLPFRITDMTRVNDHFVGINYFYKGGGGDEVYRLPANDRANRFIKDTGYRNYVRLVRIRINAKKAKWEPLLDLPTAFMSYNWEGIAAYKNGYFIINDKYTPNKPYASVLLYIARSN